MTKKDYIKFADLLIKLEKTQEEFSLDDNITITVRFSILGDLRNSFTEKKLNLHMQK